MLKSYFIQNSCKTLNIKRSYMRMGIYNQRWFHILYGLKVKWGYVILLYQKAKATSQFNRCLYILFLLICIYICFWGFVFVVCWWSCSCCVCGYNILGSLTLPLALFFTFYFSKPPYLSSARQWLSSRHQPLFAHVHYFINTLLYLFDLLNSRHLSAKIALLIMKKITKWVLIYTNGLLI